jgi:pyrimidine operon attenuation protein/uracil phosphoribosyltransferase
MILEELIPLEANKTKINFIVENKKVIFIDDVFSQVRICSN